MADHQNSVEQVLPTPGYERPPEEVLEHIRRHVEGHGRDFNLRRDVAWPGNRAKRAVIDYEPANFARPARYWCADCGPGRVYVVGKPEPGPARNLHLRLTEPQLQVYLRGLPQERWDEVIEAYDEGRLGPAVVDTALARERQQTKPSKDPAYGKRLLACAAEMLRLYEELGKVDLVLDALERTLKVDGERRIELVGKDWVPSRETLQRYWKQIPVERRQATKQRYLERWKNADAAA